MTRDTKSYRILIIEDNPGDSTIVDDLLAEKILAPILVHATNFKQAATLLSEPGHRFDIVLLDLSLPDKSGQSLVTEMLRIAAPSPIIILTGYSDIAFSIKSISQGIWDYLLKDDLNAEMLYKSILYAIERKRIMSELKESEKRYSDLFNLSPQPMWVFDTETFLFVQVNNATIALYGYTKEELLKMTLMDIRQKEDIPAAKTILSNPFTGSEYYKNTIIHQKKSGERVEMEIYSTPMTINNKLYRSVIGIDVTEKNLTEHKLIKAIIQTQEEERYEIGGELHDNVCQILATSQLNLGMLECSLPPAKMELFDQVCKYIRIAIDEIRTISHRLAPAFFDDSTLEEAFGRLFDDFNVGARFVISMHFNDAVRKYSLPLDIQLNLYRILQEQLRNILKHSHAQQIDVDVIIHNNKLKLRIADDGIGFDMATVKKGIGLANIKRRSELFRGKCEIDSSPGNGCEILIVIPLPEIVEDINTLRQASS